MIHKSNQKLIIEEEAVVAEKIKDIDNLPWVEKYRPKTLDDIMGHDDIIKTIGKMVDSKKFQHILLFGPPGTGKTSTIVAAAKKVYGDAYPYMVFELNASADRGIDAIRQVLKFVNTENVFNKQFNDKDRPLLKLVILDESDAMTIEAQNSLRIIMEKHVKNARFALICNYIEKIIDANKSRCCKLKFTPIGDDNMKKRIKFVCKSEGLNITECGIETIIRKANGDMRFIFNSLQSIQKTSEPLTSDYINKEFGSPTKKQMDVIHEIIEKSDMKTAVEKIRKAVRITGLTVPDIMSELHTRVLNDTKMDQKRKFKIFDNLARVETYQAGNTNEKFQLVAMIACFKC